MPEPKDPAREHKNAAAKKATARAQELEAQALVQQQQALDEHRTEMAQRNANNASAAPPPKPLGDANVLIGKARQRATHISEFALGNTHGHHKEALLGHAELLEQLHGSEAQQALEEAVRRNYPLKLNGMSVEEAKKRVHSALDFVVKETEDVNNQVKRYVSTERATMPSEEGFLPRIFGRLGEITSHVINRHDEVLNLHERSGVSKMAIGAGEFLLGMAATQKGANWLVHSIRGNKVVFNRDDKDGGIIIKPMSTAERVLMGTLGGATFALGIGTTAMGLRTHFKGFEG